MDISSPSFLFRICVFEASKTEGKRICKQFVQRGLGLPFQGIKHGICVADQIPLVVCITRLVAQKGLHLITHAIKHVEELGGQMVVLGSASDDRVEREFEGLAELHNKGSNIRILLMYSEELSHMLYAAADMVLVPSMYEPCGLAQMIGMRYGAVPIVRKTGGLADTVFDMDDQSHTEIANGFVFEGIDEGSLNCALGRAFSYYQEKPNEWKAVVQKVMRIDNSWNNTAGKYIDIYNSDLFAPNLAMGYVARFPSPVHFFPHWRRRSSEHWIAAVKSSRSGEVAPANSHPHWQCRTSEARLLLCDGSRFCGAESAKWRPLLLIWFRLCKPAEAGNSPLLCKSLAICSSRAWGFGRF
ncbi:hypothetical protein MTR67_031941 [Solanum verrucosum]|uniref:starch synthase n=1 Tax=Solanum verrucosum TaxID=315347 RepID=A0AAF0U3F8_SOLVR|nr:hypothetical protein MTR67_031941 [Solanum verrucosum]